MAILLTTIMLALLVINSILQIIIMIAQWIFELSLNLVTSIDTTNIVSSGWTTSLQLANMFFIVVLLAIAIATILRLQNFNYKKMLPIFIMVALLINFSMTIGLVVLDASNMLAEFFLDSMGGANSITGNIASSMKIVTFAMDGDQKIVDDLAADPDAAGILSKIWGSIKNVAATAVGLATGSTQIKIIMTQLLKLVVFLTTIFMFIAGSVYMIKRAFWIWLLLILAPLAWIALIFPGGNRYFTQWWGTFTKWCIFAPAFLFFIYLGFIVGNSMATASATLTSSTTLTDIAFGGFVDIISPSLFIQMAIVPFIMLMGLSLSSKLGVGGSNFVLNYADKARGAASKKFKDMRGKSAFSAENIGERFGRFGAAASAPLSTLSGGRFGTGRGKEMQGRLELDRQKQQEEKMGQEKLKLTGRTAGMDETTRRTYLQTETASARAGTGTTTIAQTAAINMLMEDKVAMENVSEVEQGYMRQAVAAATHSNQQTNIEVNYVVTTEMGKKVREKKEKEYDAYAKHLTDQEKIKEKAKEQAAKNTKEDERAKMMAEKMAEKITEEMRKNRS